MVGGPVVVPFSVAELSNQLVFGACLASDVANNLRVKYLSVYLTEIKAATVVVELEYVDADYLDDYASFYAKSFERIPNRCRRLHFFSVTFDESKLKSILLGQSGEEFLQQSYLGFIVARPLPAAVVGRSSLCTYESDGGRRQYPAVRTYKVNFFGVRLAVESLAFQEQDTSLAACATVALWSCFQKTQDLFHSSAPSPVVITRAANRLLLAARPFPSRGLQIQQICNAIAVVGLDPEVYEVTPDLPLATLIYSYLRLGLPVLAVVQTPGLGLHAIAVNGYSLRPTQQLSSEGGNVNALLPRLIGSRIDEFYGHDDQNGPFARLRLIQPDSTKPTLTIAATGPWAGDLVPKLIVVPVYQKIRTGFREVLKWLPVLSTTVSWIVPPVDFEWDVQLAASNELKHALRSGETSAPDAIREAILLSNLPKYVWRCTLYSQRKSLFEAILDTTAMVNGFPVQRIWWTDQAHAQLMTIFLQNTLVESSIRQTLGDRVANLLTSSA